MESIGFAMIAYPLMKRPVRLERLGIAFRRLVDRLRFFAMVLSPFGVLSQKPRPT